MHDPRVPHLETAYRILHYLKSALGKGIIFSKHNYVGVEAYTDAAGSLDDCRSRLGYCTFIGGHLITRRSKSKMW